MPTRVRSHAKVNLGLAIGPVGADGYHDLATIYQTLAVHDVVEVTAKPLAHGSTSAITIGCSDARVPCDARNTCWSAVERALAHADLSARVHIQIDKRLPVQGGLGAGSANAAAALLGLERELRTAPDAGARLAIAAATGSDVPLFLIGGTVLGRGRGEEVFPLPDLPEVPCVLAIPEIGVSTPQAFRDWDRLTAQQETGAQQESALTGNAASDRLKQLGRVWAAALSSPGSDDANATGVFPVKDRAGNLLLELVRAGIENDFERVVFLQYPFLRDILDILKKPAIDGPSAFYAALSGSGSALFGVYREQSEADSAVKRLRERKIAVVATTLMNREHYWRDLVQA